MSIRGIRGAITVEQDQAQNLIQATQDLLSEILRANPQLQLEDVASALFTLTPDLCSIFPATAARQIGWTHVPMMCAQEIPVPGALPRVIRVLVHWNTTIPLSEIHHVYMGEALCLRPDLQTASS